MRSAKQQRNLDNLIISLNAYIIKNNLTYVEAAKRIGVATFTLRRWLNFDFYPNARIVPKIQRLISGRNDCPFCGKSKITIAFRADGKYVAVCLTCASVGPVCVDDNAAIETFCNPSGKLD